MSTLIINKNDFSRIHQSLLFAKQNKTVKKDDAEKLSHELKSATLVDPANVPDDVVTMNSIVKIHFANTKQKLQFKLVYPQEANLKENKISILSPVGIALIGYRTGSEIQWDLPAGKAQIIIDEIIYQPEAAGDFES